MKRITAIIVILCLAVTSLFTGLPERLITGDGPEASAASYPALKKISYKATGNQRDDIIGFAKTQLGYKEGGNNNTYFGSWFGCNYNPWCAMFVVWSARKAGVSKSVIPSLATADRSWAKNQGVYHKSKYWGGSYKPKKGDLIYFSWSVRDWADHIGMVTGTGKSGGTTYVYTIEGNKHDKVVEGSYALNNRYILGYSSPKYTTGNAKQTKTTTTTKKAVTTYTLKYRDGLDITSNDEEDKIIPPVKGTFGKNLTLSTKKFTRKGYGYVKWDVYKENSEGALIYLCRDKKTGKTEKWLKKSAIPSDYNQVFVSCGGTLNITKSFSGTVYISPVWKKGLKVTTTTTKATTKKSTTKKTTVSSFTVTYNANGGSNAPAKQTKKKGKAMTLTTAKPVRNGYVFLGWARDPNAANAEFAAGASYQTDANITLYAIWKMSAPYSAMTIAGLNTRSGPGTNFNVISAINMGTKITIEDIRGDWGRKAGGGWISLQYAPRLDGSNYYLEYRDGLRATRNDAEIIAPTMGNYSKALTTTTQKFTRPGYHYSQWKVFRYHNGVLQFYCRDKKTGDKEAWAQRGQIPDGYVIKKVKVGNQIRIRTNVGERLYMKPAWERDPYKVTTTSKIKKRKGPGTKYSVAGWISKGKTVTIVKTINGWGKLKKSGNWIRLKYTRTGSGTAATTKATTKKTVATTKAAAKKNNSSSSSTFTVKVTATNGVNARTGPSKKKSIATAYEKGNYLKISSVKNGWGKISGSGNWILLKYTRITAGYKAKITATDLNQRKGPGTKYDVVGTIAPGTYVISKINGDWCKIKSTGNWVYLAYTQRVK